MPQKYKNLVYFYYFKLSNTSFCLKMIKFLISHKSSSITRIYYLLGLIFLIICFGVIGFMLIEDYCFIDAFYTTIITITTVGYGLITEPSDIGKIFISALILFSFVIFALSVSAATSYVIDGEFHKYFKHYKISNKINIMKDHVIVCGLGRNGRQAALELKKYNVPFVILENDHQLIESMSNSQEFKDVIFVEGDATLDEDMIKSGIKNAKGVITTLPNDADNLYVVLTARSLNQNIIIITRASNDSSVKKLKVAGANNVIMPDKVGGAHMASLIMKPDIIEFLDNIFVTDNLHSNLVELTCKNLPAQYKNTTIKELNIRSRSGANIIGYKNIDGEYVINPTPDTPIKENTKLFVLGTPQQIEALKSIFHENVI